MKKIRDLILEQLSHLVGKELSIARRAAATRGFHFGHITVQEDGKRSYGEWALNIQCPWRLEGPSGIVTGDEDIFIPADQESEVDFNTWDYETDGNLQDKMIGELFKIYDLKTRSHVNSPGFMVVEKVDGDNFGGAWIYLSGGYRLVLFPSGSAYDQWRLFQPSSDEPHFVISGGKIQ